MENRVKRVMERLNLTDKEAEHKIRKEEKHRADNYHYYTGRCVLNITYKRDSL